MKAGDTVALGTFSLTAEEIVAFAQEWDPLPMHTDPEYAATTQLGHIASALHTFMVVARSVSTGYFATLPIIAGRGFREMTMRKPVRPGVPFTGVLEVESLTPRGDGRAVALMRVRAHDADGDEVISFLADLLVSV